MSGLRWGAADTNGKRGRSQTKCSRPQTMAPVVLHTLPSLRSATVDGMRGLQRQRARVFFSPAGSWQHGQRRWLPQPQRSLRARALAAVCARDVPGGARRFLSRFAEALGVQPFGAAVALLSAENAPMCLVEAFLGLFYDFKCLNMPQRHCHNTRDHNYCAEKHICAPMHEFSLKNSTPVRPRRW